MQQLYMLNWEKFAISYQLFKMLAYVSVIYVNAYIFKLVTDLQKLAQNQNPVICLLSPS